VSPLSTGRDARPAVRMAHSPDDTERRLLNDLEFRRMLVLERRRSERTRAPFLLMQAEPADQKEQAGESATLHKMADVLLRDSRATDFVGWYQEGTALGVLFTGLASGDRNSMLGTIAERVKATLECDLTSDDCANVRLSFHFFPDDWDFSDSNNPGDPALYIDATLTSSRKRVQLGIKRVIDIVFSATVLVVLSPLLLWIALTIKVTSEGPVFFRQKRVGQFGKQFVFLKFRTMYVDSSEEVHQRLVNPLMAGNAPLQRMRDDEEAPYKLHNDARITAIGRLLRRMSLDELPQLLNVLKGEMSLVGPRPAIPYEVEAYQTWHRRRVLAAKPGMTGIWQVNGRSRVKFDEMVRMDLRYAMAWSPWLDLKILLLTPFAIIRGSGAL
jgi:lipopolysaccharide/colanic/teichoic acid biosynthesis glycosyltransferase